MGQSDQGTTEHYAAELMARLGGLLTPPSQSDLTTAQWASLRYFARANRFSQTVSAFADFQGTTRGTASQTVKTLVGRGLLIRSQSAVDGRSHRVGLTACGRTVLRDDPLHKLSRAVADLTDSSQAELVVLLQRLLDSVSGAAGKPAFGRCDDCYFRSGDCCRLVNETLAPGELELHCINHQTSGSATSTTSDT